MSKTAKRFLAIPIVLILLLALMFGNIGNLSISASAAGAHGKVTITDSKTTFRHFDYTLNADNGFVSGDPNKIVSTEFNTKVVENDFIKATFLPDYGARLLSIVYKPTGHELLYQNPVGTPYAIKEGNFYYDWLMVYGGIMPTMSEPEHGKYWLEPWDYEVVVQNDNQVSIRMTQTDTIDFAGRPGKFNKGATGMTCSVVYTIYADKPYVEMAVNLVNNQTYPINYEYWTCNTLAPGSTYGNTVGSPSMEIVAPMTQVKNKDDWWPWMGTVDDVVDPSNHIFKFDNLAKFSNWAGQGISYSNDLSGDWWGVINHDNGEGILRISDNKKTPGLKMWTWGFEDSFNTNPETSYGNSARPYIELWGGTSHEFFENAVLPANGQLSWVEYYYPTVGLENVTNANENAAIYMWAEESEGGYILNSTLNTNLIDEALTLTLNLKGSGAEQIATKDFIGSTAVESLNASISSDALTEDAYVAEAVLSAQNGDTLLTATIPLKGNRAPDPSKDLAKTWYLYNSSSEGVSGETMQAEHSGTTGWQPLKTITSDASVWYTPNLEGAYAAGAWTFTLWTEPVSAQSNIAVELYKTSYDGADATMLASQIVDVSSTGTGNHPSTFILDCATVDLHNERLMIKIYKVSGDDVVMAYNTNDFPTALETP